MPTNKSTPYIFLSEEIAAILQEKSYQLALKGGPQETGNQKLAEDIATELFELFNDNDKKLINDYISGKITHLVFDDFLNTDIDGNPIKLPQENQFPTLEELEADIEVLKLASQEQIILALLNETTFAFDSENEGKIVRVVANFRGGGTQKLANEAPDGSSHSGKAVVPHTEDPYYSSTKVEQGHSPSPSSLILTARWNPLSETTKLAPIERVLSQLSKEEIVALAGKNFNFRAAKTASEGKSVGGTHVSILDLNDKGRLAANYNLERFSVDPAASEFIKDTYAKFSQLAAEIKFDEINLQPNRTLVINNPLNFHCRDTVKDNRRVLVRVFGYRKNVDYLPINQDPLIVKG